MKIYEVTGEPGGTYIKSEREAAKAAAVMNTTENKKASPAEYGGLNLSSNMIVIPRGTTYRLKLSLVYPGAKWLKAAKRNPVYPFQRHDRVFSALKRIRMTLIIFLSMNLK